MSGGDRGSSGATGILASDSGTRVPGEAFGTDGVDGVGLSPALFDLETEVRCGGGRISGEPSRSVDK